MSSLLSTLDMAKRALSAQQAAINTTGNNISNASTPGYSRQTVDLVESPAFPSVGMNQPAIAGQEGTGVDATSVSRIRDTFVDQQVRQQTTSNGYWSAKSDALSQMENIMNEPSDSGLSTALNNFWGAWQDLSDDPSNSGSQSVVVQDGTTVADTFNYLSNSLTQVQSNIGTNIGTTADQINTIASQINDLNKQIATVEPTGLNANALYDQRDQLVDQLSQLTDIQVTSIPSGGNSSAGAAGIYNIQIKSTDPNTGQATLTTLVDGNTLKTNTVSVDLSSNTVSVGSTQIPAGFGGKLQGLMDSYSQDFPQMLDKLNTMANTLANSVNQKIQDYNSANPNSTQLEDFFAQNNNTNTTSTSTLDASNIGVNSDLQNNPSLVASGELVQDSDSGDSIPIALSISNTIGSDQHSFNGQQSTFQGYYQAVIGQMGVNAQAANNMTTNTQSLLDSATSQRDSVSGVSIDEEMTNLIEYQHAYSASARMVSTINSLLDTLMNLGN